MLNNYKNSYFDNFDNLVSHSNESALENLKFWKDIDFNEVSKVAKAITPVPGGVGPMTIACLLSNTVQCFEKSQSN